MPPSASSVLQLPPKLRGLLHVGAVPFAAAAGALLVVLSPDAVTRVGSAVFVASAVANFVLSAALHRGRWRPRVITVLRRLDHASIFLLIAGSYTPFSLLLLQGADQVALLSIVWGGAALGITFRLLRPDGHRWVSTLLYLALGWAAVFYAPALFNHAGDVVGALIVTGAALYTIGAVVYATQWPNPSRDWFGFHEVFHALTISAFVAHYVAVSAATYARR